MLCRHEFAPRKPALYSYSSDRWASVSADQAEAHNTDVTRRQWSSIIT